MGLYWHRRSVWIKGDREDEIKEGFGLLASTGQDNTMPNPNVNMPCPSRKWKNGPEGNSEISSGLEGQGCQPQPE